MALNHSSTTSTQHMSLARTDSSVARRQHLQSFDMLIRHLFIQWTPRTCSMRHCQANRERITYAKVGIWDLRSVLDNRRFGYSSTLFILAETDILHDEHVQPPKKRISRNEGSASSSRANMRCATWQWQDHCRNIEHGGPHFTLCVTVLEQAPGDWHTN